MSKSHKCRMPKLAELRPCVAQCAECGRYWELKATWVPYERATKSDKATDR